ncbi:MAG: SpoIIE family protein phosphatase [Deltaproteobacteria bacterium]|nr:SpoIIE family protein phosphatase [Deltaproteobacteria bacterium]
MDYAWNWLSVPYLACALSLISVGLTAALVRGDRVLRLGTIGAATTALPWALCSAVATWTPDPVLAERLLRLGNGPTALVGPSLLLVLLGVSGQLERHRWIARIAGVIGLTSLAICWGTKWVVAGVHVIPAGTFYISPGPLTGLHFSQIAIWLVIGIFVVRRATTGGERRRIQGMLVGVLALGAIGSTDLLLVYDIGGYFPIAWLSATIAALAALRLELKTDLLRPQGFDRPIFIELLGFLITAVIVGVIALSLDDAAPVTLAVIASVVWTAVLGVTWTFAADQPVRIARERALEQLIAALGDVHEDAEIGRRLRTLWKEVSIEVRHTFRADGDALVDVESGERRAIDREVAAWLVEHGEMLAAGDLGTMRVGPIRPMLEGLVARGGASLLVPLIDRGALVGLVEADHVAALREDERGLVLESARAAARAMTYVALSREAALEGETAREVEVAEAMRLQASASRDDELGRWMVAAEYRTAARTTGAGWSAILLADGRLAVLVTEAQAHGVAAALATAALTGAFAAATSTTASIALDDLLTSLRASAEGVIRGGEPVAAFVAILDASTGRVQWAAAGHPGAMVVGPVAYDVAFPAGSVNAARPRTIALGGGGARLGASLVAATRGETALDADSLLVIASTAVRGDDEARWQQVLADQAPAGSRLASMLVDSVLRAGKPPEDLLAVVVRRRTPGPGGVTVPPSTSASG